MPPRATSTAPARPLSETVSRATATASASVSSASTPPAPPPARQAGEGAGPPGDGPGVRGGVQREPPACPEPRGGHGQDAGPRAQVKDPIARPDEPLNPHTQQQRRR